MHLLGSSIDTYNNNNNMDIDTALHLGETDEWSNQAVSACLQGSMHHDKFLAFAMGRHDRLGSDSDSDSDSGVGSKSGSKACSKTGSKGACSKGAGQCFVRDLSRDLDSDSESKSGSSACLKGAGRCFVRDLSRDLVLRIMMRYFSLPSDYFSPTRKMPTYMGVLESAEMEA
jgi:hypothetical protein